MEIFGFTIIGTEDFEAMQLKHQREIYNRNIRLDANEKRIAQLFKENNQLKYDKAKLEAENKALKKRESKLEKAYQTIRHLEAEIERIKDRR